MDAIDAVPTDAANAASAKRRANADAKRIAIALIFFNVGKTIPGSLRED